MKIKYIKQTDLRDCGVSCLMALINYYKGKQDILKRHHLILKKQN